MVIPDIRYSPVGRHPHPRDRHQSNACLNQPPREQHGFAPFIPSIFVARARIFFFEVKRTLSDGRGQHPHGLFAVVTQASRGGQVIKAAIELFDCLNQSLPSQKPGITQVGRQGHTVGGAFGAPPSRCGNLHRVMFRTQPASMGSGVGHTGMANGPWDSHGRGEHAGWRKR